MTLAVCVKCGATKLGALTWCPGCEFQPGSDPDNLDDLYSMILSDHNFDAAELDRFSKGMKAGMPMPRLSTGQETEFRENYRASIKRVNASRLGRLLGWLTRRK